MVQDALRGLVPRALRYALEGPKALPGDHHFFLTFRTGFPGVEISETLKEKFPEELNIALQHQFWDLEVGEESFSVTVSFNRIRERLTVPYLALTHFHDPSVPFGLQFKVPEPRSSSKTFLNVVREPEETTTNDSALPKPRRSNSSVSKQKPSPEEGNVVSLDQFRPKPKLE